MDLKGFLWRCLYAVILVVILTYLTPLLFQLVGLPIPGGVAVQILKFVFACLVLVFVFFGPTPPTPF